jgi:hypothetical protein
MTNPILGKKLGQVADFCPMCREIRPLALHRSIVIHGKMQAEVHAVRCDQCGFARIANIADYKASAPEPIIDLETLISRTNPHIRDRIAPRLALEEDVKDGRVDKAVRDQLIREPINLLLPTIENPPGGERVGCVIGSGFGIFVVGLAVSTLVSKSASVIIGVIAFGALLVSLVLLALMMIFSPLWRAWWRKRYLVKTGYSLLGRALRPLNPSEDELRAAIQGMKSLGLRAAGFLDAGTLHHAAAAAKEDNSPS